MEVRIVLTILIYNRLRFDDIDRTEECDVGRTCMSI